MSKIGRKYGYIKHDLVDSDPKIKFTPLHAKQLGGAKAPSVLNLATQYNLPQALSEIDQGNLGSCTGNATAYALAVDQIKQKNTMAFLPSRLFIYYNARLIEGTPSEDSGAQISDVIKGVAQYGAVDEHHYIYDPEVFANKPPANIYTEAKLFSMTKYAALDLEADKSVGARINHLKLTLQSGYPIVFGFSVYDSFESDEVAKTGMMPMPKSGEQIVGGHAVCCVGYDDSKQCMLIKNSWGADWGLNGYFYMPYNFIGDMNMTNDFWVIEQVSNPNDIPGWNKVDISPDAINLQSQPSSRGVVNNQGSGSSSSSQE
jgi:C1A family cysteine protease